MAWLDGTSTGRTASALESRLSSDVISLNVRGASTGLSAAANKAIIDAAIVEAAASGGTVLWGPGTYTTNGGHLVKSNVHHCGCGVGATTVKLADSANTDLFVGDNFATLTTGTSQSGPSKWGFSGITLDGNTANNTSGWPLRVYGSQYTVDEVEFKNGASGGVWSEWGTGGTDMEATWSNFRIHDCDGNGLDWRGPHDSAFTNGFIFKNTNTGYVSSDNATSELLTNVHIWGTEHDYAFYFNKQTYCVNCVAEGATTANVVLNCNFGAWRGGSIFGTNTGVETGIKVGDTSTARYWSIDTFVRNFASGGKPIDFSNTSRNDIRLNVNAGSCTRIVHGTPSSLENIRVVCGDNPALAGDVDYGSNMKEHGYFKLYGADTYRGVMLASVGTTTSFMQLLESTSVSNASTNGARIAAIDNGAGKTQLVVRFASGASQVIATEP